MDRGIAASVVVVASVSWAMGARAAAPGFEVLIFDPSQINSGADLLSDVRSVSADGLVVAGYGRVSGPVELFAWTEAGGPTVIGESGLWFDGDELRVSGDGRVLIADARVPGGGVLFGVRWTEVSGWEVLEDSATGSTLDRARGVNADGSVVVGWRSVGSIREAAVWKNGVIQGLGDLPGGAAHSEAWDVSADGNVVVGLSASANGVEAFRWTEAGGMVGLGDLDGGLFDSWARAISADGTVIVGRGTTATGPEAFRWTEAGGMQGIGYPSGLAGSAALGVNGDGSVIVGSTTSWSGGFVWSAGIGMRSLQEYLEVTLGVSAQGITLRLPSDVSADGGTIVGAGRNEYEQTVGWVAVIPAPLCAGDVDGDGATTVADFGVLASNFGASVTEGTGGDLNGDGIVNAGDFVILAGDFGCGS